jgi:hypothetical protein
MSRRAGAEHMCSCKDCAEQMRTGRSRSQKFIADVAYASHLLPLVSCIRA